MSIHRLALQDQSHMGASFQDRGESNHSIPRPGDQEPSIQHVTSNLGIQGTISPSQQVDQRNRIHPPRWQSLENTDIHLVTHPSLLEGVQCYTDASISPDSLSTNLRNAGLGVFIVNAHLQPVQTIHVKATLNAATLVLMAEAAALALAAIVTHKLGLHRVTFLSDNQQLVHFLNDQDQSNPPEWRIKYYTQFFGNFSSQRNTRICRIRRGQNQTADTLARQALIDSQLSDSLDFICTCTSAAHDQCSLQETLHSVNLNSVRLLAASCC